MGNGQHPGPTDAATAFPVDDGTLARISSPPPAPIGLKGGNAKGGTASLGEQVASYVRQRRGQVVGDGECFTAADNALRNANARSAADYGTVTPDADYQWGTPVNQSDLRTGDIVQFRNYRYDREIETGHTDGSSETQTDFQERPHHTAIVERVGAGGAVTVLEQNAPVGAPVTRNELFFSDRNETSGEVRTTIRVRGRFWFYRPEAR